MFYDYEKFYSRCGSLTYTKIAESYWNLHTQSLSTLTHEIEIRPFIEKW
jgi:hypothetical protein